MGAVNMNSAALLLLKPIIKDLALDGTLSARDEALIRDRLAGLDAATVDQVVIGAKSDAAFFRQTFDDLASSGTLGALEPPTAGNIRKVNRNYVHHKAAVMVADQSSWFGANLKEAELGKAFATFLRDDPTNANNVLQHTLGVTSEHVDLNNRDEVASGLLAELSDDELVSLLTGDSLYVLSDSLKGVYYLNETETSRSTISEGYVTDGEKSDLARIEWALAEKAR